MRPRFFLLLALVFAACDGASKPANDAAAAKLWEEFSGEKALHHVERLVELGPRPPGSEALERARVYITDELKAAGWHITRQTFKDSTPRGPMTFVNLLATFGEAKDEKKPPSFLLCSHYDTKLFETESFVGANDGGSSNGVLLERRGCWRRDRNLRRACSWFSSMARKRTSRLPPRTAFTAADILRSNSR